MEILSCSNIAKLCLRGIAASSPAPHIENKVELSQDPGDPAAGSKDRGDGGKEKRERRHTQCPPETDSV